MILLKEKISFEDYFAADFTYEACLILRFLIRINNW